jgi:hypothetical protein
MVDNLDDEDGDEGEYASAEEASAAVQALNDDEVMKLMVVARYHWKQRRLRDSMSPEELLGEAIVRTLDNRRRWRRGRVSLIYHLDRTMESISGHAVHDAVTEHEIIAEIGAEQIDPKTAEPRRFQSPVVERQLVARAELASIEALFADAPDALVVLRLKAEGHTESEIMNLRGMDKRRYEAARKKAEREITKYVFHSEKGKK